MRGKGRGGGRRSAETIWKEKLECKEWNKRRVRRKEIIQDKGDEKRGGFDEDVFEAGLLSKDCDVTGQMGHWRISR